MTLSRTTGILFVLVATAIGLVSGACGTDGDDGAPGAQGAPGPAGPAGPPGPAAPGTATDGGVPGLGGACTQPCHTFNGVVDQWRFSNHSHPQKSEVGGGACGNCHAVDGIQQRVANKYVIAADASAPTNVAQGHLGYRSATNAASEISYAGASVIGRIHCSTCHDFNPTNDPHVTGKYVAGQAPLRVAGGATDNVYLEKSADAGASTGTPLAYKSANTCVFCHKSRKDVTAYIDPTTNKLTSTTWGPHEGPQADIYSAQGAYQLDGKLYGASEHVTIANKCVTCHMAPVATNGNVPDHTMKPTVKTCTGTAGCHSQYTGTTFDILGGQTSVKKALFELQRILNDAGLLTRSATAPYVAIDEAELVDGQFHLDKVRPGLTVDGPTAGILYNYLLIARGKDMGAHNPRYTKQLLFDAIEKLTGAAPTSGLTRPN
jgi:hypothetical protein